MLAELRDKLAVHAMHGPVSLPVPLPDIDLVMSDEETSTVAIIELKWIRKTARPIEISELDSEVLKGIDQLRRISLFLHEKPDHLASLGILSKPLDAYQHLFYLLVARDHWRWVEPTDVAIVEFDAFLQALRASGDLHAAISELLHYGWLPVEGRDFVVRYERATANGVAIESESFFSLT